MMTKREQDMALRILNWVVRFKVRPVQSYRKRGCNSTFHHSQYWRSCFGCSLRWQNDTKAKTSPVLAVFGSASGTDNNCYHERCSRSLCCSTHFLLRAVRDTAARAICTAVPHACEQAAPPTVTLTAALRK
jgi:hypothetical protein